LGKEGVCFKKWGAVMRDFFFIGAFMGSFICKNNFLLVFLGAFMRSFISTGFGGFFFFFYSFDFG
jgi:hypothetical protein